MYRSDYSPHIWHSAALSLIAIAFMGLASDPDKNTIPLAGFIIFSILALVSLYLLIKAEARLHLESRTYFLEAYGKLDEQARQVMAFYFPDLDLDFTLDGELIEYIRGTDIKLPYLRQFLFECFEQENRVFVVPKRDWRMNTAEFPERVTQWEVIFKWLKGKSFVVPDRLAANETWQFRTPSIYKQMVMLYIENTMKLQEL